LDPTGIEETIMKKISEAITSDECRVDKVIMFIDMTDSTNMKEREPETAWLGTYAWFFDKVSEAIEEKGGAIVKYLGDGVMAAFSADEADAAINAGVLIQEQIADADSVRRAHCNCTIAIATGEVVEIHTPSGESDYIGVVVDRAARLCSAASPKAVFVDRLTIASARMNKVSSDFGSHVKPRRKADDYQGDIQKISLKGINVPVEYHEILWADQRYGLKSSVATAAIEAVVHQVMPRSHTPNTSEWSGSELRSGTVKMWDSSKSMGFAESNGEDFYINTRGMVVEDDLEVGDQVYFLPRETTGPGKARPTVCVIVHGEELEGTVKKMGPPSLKNFGFVEIIDKFRNSIDLFMHVGDNPLGIKSGDRVAFDVGANSRGPCALNPRLISPAGVPST
jgi:class 3 adenylate cyclase/cold shock CspA family protein